MPPSQVTQIAEQSETWVVGGCFGAVFWNVAV